MGREKYGALVKKQVMKEYFEGASAKELSAKYGVKQRTIYLWSKKARSNDLVSENEEKGINYLQSIVGIDNRNPSLEDRVKHLEEIIFRSVR